LLDLCLAVLVGALALYAAVAVVTAIWRPLAFIVGAVVAVVGVGWLLLTLVRRRRGW
jgi:ABC-type Fe3+-siderophore transport system permease subunit